MNPAAMVTPARNSAAAAIVSGSLGATSNSSAAIKRPDASAGLLLFYSRRLYAGLGFSSKSLIMHSYGLDRPGVKPAHLGQTLHIRLRNDRHIVTMHYSVDGRTWERFDRGIEVSGYHHNVAYDFLSLRPAIYAAGSGEVRFRSFRYRALD